MRRFGFQVAVLFLLLITPPLAGEAGAFPAGRRFRPALFGMICALSPGEAPEGKALPGPYRPGRDGLPRAVTDALAMGHLLVNEGGFDYAQVLKSAGPGKVANANNPSALLQAYQKLLGDNSGGRVRGLLRIVPVCLAYVKRPEEALSAATLAAAVEHPGATDLRAAGRAFCIILQGCLNGEQQGRKAIIRQAIENCGAESIRDALRIVLTDSPLDEVSDKVPDALAMVVRAWYDSNSYQDALRRLGRHAQRSRRALTGVLAGASYGLQGVGYACWPRASLAGELDVLSRQLVDLARDGVLLPVDEDAAVKLAASGKEKSLPASRAGPEPLPPKFPVELVPPAPPEIIPPVPPVPPAEPEPHPPTCKDIPLFPRSP